MNFGSSGGLGLSFVVVKDEKQTKFVLANSN
jgi:hypothetical protein